MIWRSALSFASRNRLSILILHRVLPKGDPLFPNEPVATEFDELLRHIKSTYNVLRLSDAIERLQAGSLPRRALSISFDDGYADNLSVAAPILRTHGLPATLFITTGYLDGGSMWNDVVIEAFRGTKRSQMDLTHIGLGIHPLASIDDRRVAIERVLGHPLGQPTLDAESDTSQPLAPGMLASHYAPRSRLRLGAENIEPGEALLAFGPSLPPGADGAKAVMNLSARGDLTEAAANLFGYLRALDARAARAIAVMPIPQDGLGEAINDRLRRAAMGRE